MINRDPQIHFVISAPRSGSTWLTGALNSHPEILATENRLFGMFCEFWQNRAGHTAPRITADKYLQGLANHSSWNQLGYESAAELQQALLNEWMECLFGFLARQSGRTVIVDKVTPYLGTSSIVLQKITSLFPASKIIHLIRDGRDVATSGVFDWLGRAAGTAEKDHPRDEFFVGDQTGMTLNRFFDDTSLQNWCRYWTEPIQAVQQSGPSDQVITVKYEQMVQDHATILTSVFEFLDVDASQDVAAGCAELSSFENMTGRAAGQADPLAKARRGVAGDWQNWFTRRDARLFCDQAGQTLIDENYVTDDSWVEQCPEDLDLKS